MTSKKFNPGKIKKVGIITKKNIHESKKLLRKLVRYLKKNGKEIIFDKNSAKFFKNEKGHKKKSLLAKSDLAIVLGGDGTLLKTARRLCRKRLLILGVNLGTLGFLTECTKEKLFECLDKVFKGQYEVDKRTVLRVTIYRNNKKIETYLALNDAVINQGSFARLIEINLEIDGRQMVRFKADGLIVASPTGSTAHSLSAGGPIVHPKIEGLIINPVCPHSLSMRPIVVPNNRQITATIDTERRDKNAIIGLTLDGQDTMVLKFGDKIKFRKSKRQIYFVRTGNRYYKMLRSKLNWG